MPPLSVLMEMAFLLQISASPIEVNFNADMNEKPENIYSIYYPTITTRWVISIIFTHSEWVILSKTTHSEWVFLETDKGEMNGNNVVTYMMQGNNYNDARKQLFVIAWHLSCDYTTLIIRSDDKCRIITRHIPMYK